MGKNDEKWVVLTRFAVAFKYVFHVLCCFIPFALMKLPQIFLKYVENIKHNTTS